MVELKEEEDLPSLIQRSRALQDRLSREINGLNKTPSRLCRPCYARAWNNKPIHDHDVEKEWLAGVRDSIRDVGHMLSSLQNLGKMHKRRRQINVTSLEESRARLMESARRHQETRGGPNHLVWKMEESYGVKRTNACWGPREPWRRVVQVMWVRILSPLVEWGRRVWPVWMTRRLIVLWLSVLALKAMVGRKTKMLRSEGVPEDCGIANNTFLFRGKG